MSGTDSSSQSGNHLPAGAVPGDPWWARMGFQVLGDSSTLTRLLVLLGFVAALLMIAAPSVVAAGVAHGVGPVLTSAAVRWGGGVFAVVALAVRGWIGWRRRSR